MPAWLAPLVAAGAGLIGGERSNKINQREAEKNRNWQTREADKNRSFQERMRNTEWQAAVADMHAAGINPAVAYSQGGAAAPGGSMGGGATAASATDTVSSAMQMSMQQKGMQLLDAQVKKAKGEARSAEAVGHLDDARRNFLLNLEGGQSEALYRRQLRAAIEGAEATNDLTINRSQILGPQSELMQTLENALRPILQRLSNAGGAAMNSLRKKVRNR